MEKSLAELKTDAKVRDALLMAAMDSRGGDPILDEFKSLALKSYEANDTMSFLKARVEMRKLVGPRIEQLKRASEFDEHLLEQLKQELASKGIYDTSGSTGVMRK